MVSGRYCKVKTGHIDHCLGKKYICQWYTDYRIYHFLMLESNEMVVLDILKLWQLFLMLVFLMSEVTNVIVWQGMDSPHLIVVDKFFFVSIKCFLVCKNSLQWVLWKLFGNFSIAKWHENG